MKLKYYIYILAISLLSTSCGDFLEGRSLDKTIPSKLEHYKELMMGDIYLENYYSLSSLTHLMTDDISDAVAGDLDATSIDRRLEPTVPWYKFAVQTQIDKIGGRNSDDSWLLLYDNILTCNIIEYEVGKLKEDEVGEKYTIIAETQVMRAIAYFNLVNMYGEIYQDAEQAKKAFGVPINLETGIKDIIYERSTLAENYALIEKDLLSAIENFDKGEKYLTKFRPDANVARFYLSKLYLNMKQWDKVITYCDDVMNYSDAKITPLSIIKKYTDYGPWPDENADGAQGPSGLYDSNNPGFLFSYGLGLRKPEIEGDLGEYRYRVSPELISLYGMSMEDAIDEGFDEETFYGIKDIRSHKYFLLNDSDFLGKGTFFNSKHSQEHADFACRIEEVYFNKAEALLETGDYMAAMDLINLVRIERINDVDYMLEPSDAAEAKQMFRDEKRREFCFENIRWNDIRRWGIPVTHRFQEVGGSTSSYTLKVGSPNWVLPLPLDVTSVNRVIERVQREDCFTGTI